MFLHNPSPAQLEAAAALNHREWMLLKAQAAQGEVHHLEGVTWTYAGARGEAMVLFPRMTAENADSQLDTMTRFYQEHPPQTLVGCWSLAPPQPLDLELRLLARGFQLGWEPRWMALDFQNMNRDHAQPAGLEITLVEEEPDWDVNDLPYHSCDTSMIRHAATRLCPQQVWHFAAWLDGKPVGQSTLCLTHGPLGVAGLYDIGVVPHARNQGVGKAITLVACQHAQTLGWEHALLNATGPDMYRQIGFQEVGYGKTWWLDARRLAAHPPSKQQILLAEAVGRGDSEALAAIGQQGISQDLNVALTNGMTLMELAVHAQQPTSVDWLVAHGAKGNSA